MQWWWRRVSVQKQKNAIPGRNVRSGKYMHTQMVWVWETIFVSFSFVMLSRIMMCACTNRQNDIAHNWERYKAKYSLGNNSFVCSNRFVSMPAASMAAAAAAYIVIISMMQIISLRSLVHLLLLRLDTKNASFFLHSDKCGFVVIEVFRS